MLGLKKIFNEVILCVILMLWSPNGDANHVGIDFEHLGFTAL